MALTDAFTVIVNGVNNTVQSVEVSGTSATLVVEDRIEFGDTISVSYVVPAVSPITDRAGNKLASFSSKVVGNETFDPDDSTPPEVDDASTDVEGFEISVSFDEPVRASAPPPSVTSLSVLDSGEDTENENRYFIEWRWSPGLETDITRRDNYQYRVRRVTNPETAWGGYTTTELGSVRIGNLLPNAEYQIQVVATNTGGDSEPVTDTAATPIVSSGEAPINFAITDKGRKFVNSSFKYFMAFSFARDPSDDAPLTRYEYRSKETSGSAWTGWVDNGTDLTFEIDTFSRNTSYDIEVRLVNFIGVSDAATVTDMVTFNKPAAPMIIVAEGSRSGGVGSYGYQIMLAWEDKGTDTAPTDSFRISHRENTSTSWTRDTLPNLSGTTTEYTLTGLEHTKEYDVRVTAFNNVGNGSSVVSDIAAFTKPGPVTMVTCSHVQIGPVGGRVNQVVYGWQLPPQDGSNTVDDVLIRTRKSTESWGAFVAQGATATTHTIMNADDNTTYEIEVKTRNSAGDSAVATESCEVKSLRTGPTPEAYVYSSSGLIQVSAFSWVAEEKWMEVEFHLGGENSFRPLQEGNNMDQRLVTLPENPDPFDFVFASIVLGTPAPAGTTFSGTMVRIRYLNASKEPTTEWGVAQATEL